MESVARAVSDSLLAFVKCSYEGSAAVVWDGIRSVNANAFAN